MFGDGMQKNELPLIIVCDDKDMVYANYLIQLIGQKDDAGDSIVGVEDDSVSAAIYTVKNYKDNLPADSIHAAHPFYWADKRCQGTEQNNSRCVQ